MSIIAPGAVFSGKYRVVRELGRGGMGVVLEVAHTRTGRGFALKLLGGRQASSEKTRARFEREAASAGALRSPHIIDVFDIDQTADGTPYLLMDLLEGHDLGTVLKTPQPIPPTLAVDWIIQACSGMAEAHRAGIIHRDLKPSNLFLSQPGGVLKIVDFGISKLLDDSELTGSLELLGTPRYMAPEQISAKTVDHRADIYSLCVILYRLLTRRLPHEQEETTDPLSLALAKVTKEPMPIEVFEPGLPEGLRREVMRGISMHLEDRQQSARELAEVLLPFGTGRIAFEEVEDHARRYHIEAVLQDPAVARRDPLETVVTRAEVDPPPPEEPVAALAPAEGAAPGTATATEAGSNLDEPFSQSGFVFTDQLPTARMPPAAPGTIYRAPQAALPVLQDASMRAPLLIGVAIGLAFAVVALAVALVVSQRTATPSVAAQDAASSTGSVPAIPPSASAAETAPPRRRPRVQVIPSPMPRVGPTSPEAVDPPPKPAPRPRQWPRPPSQPPEFL